MKEAILVDTSVWIDFFNNVDNEQVKLLSDYIENDYPIMLCPTIIQEVLQGIKSDKQYDEVKNGLFCFNILSDDSIEQALGAVKIYRKLRKKGITIRKSNDCLIAYYAVKYNLKVVHRDRDFDLILQIK